MTTAPEADRGPGGLAADVQRFGLLSAAAVVSRYAAIVDRAVPTGAPPMEAPGRAEVGPDWLVDGVPRLAEAALRLLDRATALAVEVSTASSPAAPEYAELPPVSPGACTHVSVWLHNPTPAVAVERLHATCLVSGTGAVLPAEAVSCDLADGVQVAPGGSCEVGIRVTVPAHQPAGRYHGLVVGSVAREPIRVALQVTGGGVEAP